MVVILITSQAQSVPKTTRTDTAYCIRLWNDWAENRNKHTKEIVPAFDQLHDKSLLQCWLTRESQFCTLMADSVCFEHERRNAGKSSDNHEHITFTPTTKVPQTWRAFIECRKCKRSIGLAYLQSARFKLKHHHKSIVAGCFDQATHSSPTFFSNDK